MSTHIEKTAKFASGFGCLVAIAAPIVALLIYPRANWLFAFAPVGVAVLILNRLFAKDPTPRALADEIESLLAGDFREWDVDDFEHRRIRDPQLRELWRDSMDVGGLPEEWIRLNEEKKRQLQEIICKLRELGEARARTTSPG